VRHQRSPVEDLDEDLEVLDASDHGAAQAVGNSPRRRLVVGIAASCLAVGGFVGWGLRSPRGPSRQLDRTVLPLSPAETVTVPNAMGMSPWAAQGLLARSGLASSVERRDPLTETSRVFAQKPAAGDAVSAGSFVGLRTQETRDALDRYQCTYGVNEVSFTADGLPHVGASTSRAKVVEILGQNFDRVAQYPRPTAVTVGPGFGRAWRWRGREGGPYEIVRVRDFAILVHIASVTDCPRGQRPAAFINGVPVFYTAG
jgi:hypothetical protein